MIDPRTPEGKLTLKYRGFPTGLLLSMLDLEKDVMADRPFYSRNEIIEMLVNRRLTINPRNK